MHFYLNPNCTCVLCYNCICCECQLLASADSDSVLATGYATTALELSRMSIETSNINLVFSWKGGGAVVYVY
jgi:hypothetical protein